MTKNVVIIGAGAAGLMAAGFMAQRGAVVTLLEKNDRTAVKVRISGKGRCNITNALPVREFPAHYGSNGSFLYGALHRFSNLDCIDFFARLGVETKVERGQRVFPVSDDANQVADALERFARDEGAEILFQHKAVGIVLAEDGRISGVQSLHEKEMKHHPADAVIVATGGVSYPGTGSTGDGYRFARRLGHNIIEPRPALVPVRVAEKWPRQLSGLTLKNVELSLLNPAGGKQAFFGELLFTHFGLSGPIVLTASELIGQWVDASKQPVQAYLDLKPALSDEQLNRRLLRELEAHSRKQLGSVLKELLPQRLISIILELSELPAEHPNHQVTREERLRLVGVLKNLPLTITGTLPVAAAIVTAGGVDLKEVDPKTMESKLHKGLYFIGEVLDVNGVTGGFNLQAAFSTAYCAAHAVEL